MMKKRAENQASDKNPRQMPYRQLDETHANKHSADGYLLAWRPPPRRGTQRCPHLRSLPFEISSWLMADYADYLTLMWAISPAVGCGRTALRTLKLKGSYPASDPTPFCSGVCGPTRAPSSHHPAALPNLQLRS
jgi:hypothetical protein